jgi:transposase-like protein
MGRKNNRENSFVLLDAQPSLVILDSMERQIRHPGEAKNEVLKAIPEACVDETAAVEFLEKQRWGDTPTCPHCGNTDVVKMQAQDGTRNKRFLWRCHGCKEQFTVRVGMIMEDSRVPLRVWCRALWRACSSKKGVSALQISRECSITYKSALFLMHRIRYGMAEPKPGEKLTGTVETDETYVGGKPRRKGMSKRGWGTNKTPVLAMVQRPGNVRARVIANVTAKTLKREMLGAIDTSARLCTDELKTYRNIGKLFAGGHGTVLHSAEEYVNENGDSVNTAECFFSLLKRKFYGTHHAVSKKHLHRYIAEAEFQWNTRKCDDGERIWVAITSSEGKRLMYHQPVKKENPPESAVDDKGSQPIV